MTTRIRYIQAEYRNFKVSMLSCSTSDFKCYHTVLNKCAGRAGKNAPYNPLVPYLHTLTTSLRYIRNCHDGGKTPS